MRRHSLTHRIVLVVVLVELLCAACFSGVALWHEWRTRVAAIDAELQGRSDSLLGAVQDAEDPGDSVVVDPRELRLPPADLFAVYNQAGMLLGGSERDALPLTKRSGNGVRSMRFRGRSYRVLERTALRIIDRAETAGVGIRRPVSIVYAIPVSTARIWHEILEAAAIYIVSSLLFTAATAVLLLLLMRGLLHPVEELAAAASGVSAETLTFHPPLSARQVKELDPLVRALSSTIAGLKEAFEKQHRFLGDAAHELKTSVAVVRSTIQVLGLKTRSTEEYRAGLAAILQDNERVEELVSRMLTLAHAEEASKGLLACSAGATGIQQALRALATYADLRGVRLEAFLDPEPTVRLSGEDMRTLATNLLLNAIQHSNAGSSVAVRLFESTSSHTAVLLEVEDHGDGIAASDLPLVFDRFFRADRSRSRETGGAGLGLAICKSIVDTAGGRIDLVSVVGHGTTARVTLPLAAPTASQTDRA